MSNHNFKTAKRMADAIRVLSMDAVERAKSGHPGMPMGMADVATVLFSDFLKFNPQDPTWFDRDRFVLSAGHGSMLLYSLAHLTGYPEMTMAEIKNFRQLGSLTAGHPEYHPSIGIETTTGPLGQGLGNAVGMALAEAILNARYGNDLVDHRTYAIAGDGCLMEGISHEAISLAGHLKLGKLIVLFDDNSISIDGKTDLAVSDDQLARFKASGWHVQEIDGHNHQEIFDALSEAKSETDRPSMIACKTTIGFGAPTKGGTAKVHGSPLGSDEIQAVRNALNWEAPAFDVPEDVLKSWRATADRSKSSYDQWQNAFDHAGDEFKDVVADKHSDQCKTAVYDLMRQFAEQALNDPAKQYATRQLSGMVLEAMVPHCKALVGGSADLTGSNNTITPDSKVVTPDDYDGNYIHYGVREHGMAAAMNGIALHGGLIPYSGTFLVFSDYAKPSLRLAALMKQRVVHVLTHDSIGLGEDGPTHQPIEHLAALRAVPNLNVFRPADPLEVAECWLAALDHDETTSAIALTRQSVPPLRHEFLYGENLSAHGGYVLRREAEGANSHKVCLIATGSEVSLAIEVQKLLDEKKIAARVVSMPCRDLFEQQDKEYIEQTLGEGTQRFVIEAASPFGWEKFASSSDHIFAINSFGASAPYLDLYAHFNLTPKHIYEQILATLEG